MRNMANLRYPTKETHHFRWLYIGSTLHQYTSIPTFVQHMQNCKISVVLNLRLLLFTFTPMLLASPRPFSKVVRRHLAWTSKAEAANLVNTGLARLVVSRHLLKNMISSVRMIIPNIWKNNTCCKAPTRI